jgi:hypothetical protein
MLSCHCSTLSVHFVDAHNIQMRQSEVRSKMFNFVSLNLLKTCVYIETFYDVLM